MDNVMEFINEEKDSKRLFEGTVRDLMRDYSLDQDIADAVYENPEVAEFIENGLGAKLVEMLSVSTEDEDEGMQEVAMILNRYTEFCKELDSIGEREGVAIYQTPDGEKFAEEWAYGCYNYYIVNDE